MKNLLTKVVILNQGVDLKTLATEYDLPHYSQGQEAGRERLKSLAFLKIEGFQALMLSKKYLEAKRLLLNAAGTRIKFEKVFSKNPFTLFRTPYWKGSYVYALMDTFPELNLNILDFPKIPRHAEIIFGGVKFLETQVSESQNIDPKRVKKFLPNTLEKGIRIFTDRPITGRVPKGAYINREKLIKRATAQMAVKIERQQ